MSSTNALRATSTTTTGERSAAEIEREVEQTRARLTGTVEELKDRVSPATLAEQAMEWLRGTGGRQFLENLGGTLRDNPVPVVLVAAGIGWLALGGRGGPRQDRRWYDEGDLGAAFPAAGGPYPGETDRPADHERAGGPDDSQGGSLGERAGDMAAGLRQQAEHLAGRVGAAADEAWQGATGAARAAASGAGQAGRQVAQGAGRAWTAASETAGGLGRGAYRLGEDAGRRVSDAVAEQPLLLGAVGLALGAALGALMPPSEAEDRLMGETRDRMAGRLTGLAGEALQRAKETAGETAQRAGEQLGTVASGGAKVLGEVARDLRETVERTTQEVAATVRDGASETADRDTACGDGPPGGATTGSGPTAGAPPGTTPGSTGVTPGASPASVGGIRPPTPGTGPA
jgi:hypothetical protein